MKNLFLVLLLIINLLGCNSCKQVNSFDKTSRFVNSYQNNSLNSLQLERDSLLDVLPIKSSLRLMSNQSNNLITHIDYLKVKLISETEKVSKDSAKLFVNNYNLITNKNNYDIPTQILIGEGEGKILRDKIEVYKKLIEETCPKYTVYGLNTSEQIIDDKTTIDWEYAYFNHTVLIADLVILDKISNEVINAEIQAIIKNK